MTDWKRVWVAVRNHIDHKESMAEELTAVFIKPAACWKSNLVSFHSFRGRYEAFRKDPSQRNTAGNADIMDYKDLIRE